MARAKTTKSASITINLRSGLVLRDAGTMLKAKFEQWRWTNYDGDSPKHPDRVTLEDVDRVYQLGARTPRAAYEALLQSKGRQINRHLKGLPLTPLEDADLDAVKDHIVGVFDLVLGSKYIKLAGATKLLYPFRPALLAVLDSVVENYYWYATSIGDEASFRRLEAANTWGEYVLELLRLLREDVFAARKQIDDVLAANAGEDFAGASRVRVVESLIWAYYARGGLHPDAEDDT